jgi:hypothetical protein
VVDLERGPSADDLDSAHGAAAGRARWLSVWSLAVVSSDQLVLVDSHKVCANFVKIALD